MSTPETQFTHENFPSVYSYTDRPEALRACLEGHQALKFVPYKSGLFPASALDPEVAAATGMGMAWFRDNAHVGNALYETGRRELGVSVGRAMLRVLHNNRLTLGGIASSTLDPHDPANRLPVRVEGSTLRNDEEYRVQNDSVGYALWLPSRLIKNGDINPSHEDLEALAQTVRYLGKIEYWQDPDEGAWEEDRALRASSIGVAIAGLKEAQAIFEHRKYPHGVDIEALLRRGREALHALLPQEIRDSTSSSQSEPAYPSDIRPHPEVQAYFEGLKPFERHHDAALLFLVEPLTVLEGDMAARVVADIEQHLIREKGVIRYPGDTYWEPRFTDIMNIEERTSGAPGRTERRNMTAAGIGYSGTEAQWTIFDPLLSRYWGKRFMRSGDPQDQEKQALYLERSLRQFVPMPDGRLLLPEAYYYEYDAERGNYLKPNDHIPLLWSQANLLLALRTFEASRAT